MWIYAPILWIFLLSAACCSQEPLFVSGGVASMPSPLCPPNVFPLIWEDFETYQPGPLTEQSYRWRKRHPAAQGDGIVRRTETNAYLVMEHQPGTAPAVCLPLSPGPGLLNLQLWIPKGAQAVIRVLQDPFTDIGADQGLTLAFHPDGRLHAQIGQETLVLEYAQQAWLELMVREDPHSGAWSVELCYQGHDGVHHRPQAAWTTGRSAFGALLLDASTPGARFFLDGIFYGWSGRTRDCERAENE